MKAGKQVWTIGKGSDQYDLASDVMLTSVVYDYGKSMEIILESVNNGTKSGVLPLDMTNDCVYLADFRDRVSEENQKTLNEIIEKVNAGEITYTTQYDVE